MSRNETDLGGRKRRKQDEFVQALLTNKSVDAAAEAVKIGRATAFRWLRDPIIAERLREARRDAWGRAMAQLQEAGPEAVEALRLALREAENEATRVNAAKIILELGLRAVELNDIGERLVKLEQLTKNNWKGPGSDDRQSDSAQAGATRRANGSA
jgi:hypothetical protein